VRAPSAAALSGGAPIGCAWTRALWCSLKGSIPSTNEHGFHELRFELKSESRFSVHAPGRTYDIDAEDHGGTCTAERWVSALVEAARLSRHTVSPN
jgi:hypothetical protein